MKLNAAQWSELGKSYVENVLLRRLDLNSKKGSSSVTDLHEILAWFFPGGILGCTMFAYISAESHEFADGDFSFSFSEFSSMIV